jgi:hypothetical protein
MFSYAVLTGLQILGVAIYVLDIYSKLAAPMSDLAGKSNKISDPQWLRSKYLGPPFSHHH